jgi:hypothetical protein
MERGSWGKETLECYRRMRKTYSLRSRKPWRAMQEAVRRGNLEPKGRKGRGGYGESGSDLAGASLVEATTGPA